MEGEKGFVRMPRALLASRPSVLAVFATLMAMSDDCGGGELVVGYFDLACRCGVAVRTARGAVAQLASGGYVERRGRMKWGVRLRMTRAAGNDATADVGLNAVSDVKADGVGIAVENVIENATLDVTIKSSVTPQMEVTNKSACHSQCHTGCHIEDGAKENEKEKEQKEKDKEENSLSTGVRTYTPAQESGAAGDVSMSMSMSDWAGVFVDPPNDWREVVTIAPIYTGRAWTEQMARAFIAHYASMGWRTAGGGLIRDWRQRLAKWLLSENTPHIGMKGQYNGARRGAMALDRYEPGF